MTEQTHERAERLINASRVEGISTADHGWLGAHLESCAQCTARAAAVDRVIVSLHSVPTSLEPAVVEKTRRRVRLRARELLEHQARMRALWISCALSWVLGVVSAPLLWQGLEWIGQHWALPEAVRWVAFLLWWTVPAVLVAGVMTWRHARAVAENGDAETIRD